MNFCDPMPSPPSVLATLEGLPRWTERVLLRAIYRGGLLKGDWCALAFLENALVHRTVYLPTAPLGDAVRGYPSRSKGQGLGPCGVGLRAFESLPPHHSWHR